MSFIIHCIRCQW
uniref:Uncharacterized protein n=1 Tax=Anguilla anguilla TaxID=7936 RepID=A0A0E9T7M5_ANGAN